VRRSTTAHPRLETVTGICVDRRKGKCPIVYDGTAYEVSGIAVW
jgi:hypothetical protein